MDEREKIIMSIIDNEFEKLSINSLINELKRIPQYDFKNTRIFILKLFRDIDTAMKNSKNRIKKYFQSLKLSNDKIIKKIYFQSRNKPLLSKYNTKDSTNFNENILYQTQANAFNNIDYTSYENIQSIKNLKSSEENSSKENDEIFTKNFLEKKFLSGNNGTKGGGLKYKKKIDLGNKSLSEFKIKSKKKICLNDKYNNNFNIYKLYHKAHNDKSKNNKSNSINANKMELSLNANNKETKNEYLSNSKIFKQINLKKKNYSLNKKVTDIKLIKNNYKEKDERFKYKVNSTDKNNNYDSNINNETKIKDNRKELDYAQEKITFKDNNNNTEKIAITKNFPKPQSNNIIIENNIVSLAIDIINFIDNMKDLQKNIINKNPNIKEMKYNFENINQK